MQVIIRTFTLLAFCALLAFPALADTAPAKAGLIAFWEEAQKKDPHVSRFEKTKDADVYNFTTDFFPYKGRLKLLNAAVSKSNESYPEPLYSGIIEVELMDAPADFFRKYAASYEAWTQRNYFYYDAKNAAWFPVSEWSAHSADMYKTAASSAQGCAITAALRDAALSWLPVLVLLLFLGLAVYAARKQNRRVWGSHEKVLEGQRRSLEMGEENLKLQREQTQLLRDIAAALKKK